MSAEDTELSTFLLIDLDTNSLLHIFSYLYPIDILSLTRTCKRLKEVANLLHSLQFEACIGPKYLTLSQTEALLQVVGSSLITLSAWLDQKRNYIRLFEKYCPRLLHLHLVCFNIYQARCLKNVFENLHTLSLSFRKAGFRVDDLIGTSVHLEHIHLECCSLICPHLILPKLRVLELEFCLVVYVGQLFKNNTSIRDLKITHSKFDVGEFAEAVSSLKNLEHLKFETDDSGIQLVGFSDLKLLWDVKLCGQNLRVDNLIDLLDVSQLRRLKIEQVTLNCDSFKKLACMDRLDVLDIRYCLPCGNLKMLFGNSVKIIRFHDCDVACNEVIELIKHSIKLEQLEVYGIKERAGLQSEYLNQMSNKVIVSIL